MSTSRMIRLGPSLALFDDSVTQLIEDAMQKLPPNTVFEVRYGHSQDGKLNDLQWLTNEKMQEQTLWHRRFHHANLDPVLGADGKTPIPRVFLVARLRTGTAAATATPQIEDAPPPATA